MYAIADFLKVQDLKTPFFLFPWDMFIEEITIDQMIQAWVARDKSSHWLVWKADGFLQPFPSIIQPIFFTNFNINKLVNHSFQDLMEIVNISIMKNISFKKIIQTNTNQKNNHESTEPTISCFEKIQHNTNSIIGCLGSQLTQLSSFQNCREMNAHIALHKAGDPLTELTIVSKGIIVQKEKISGEIILSEIYFPGYIIKVVSKFNLFGYNSIFHKLKKILEMGNKTLNF